MATIKLNTIIGDCIAKKETYLIDKTGLTIEYNNSKEHCYLKNENLDSIYKLPKDGVACSKAGLFNKQSLKEITVIQCSKKTFTTKGYTSKMHFDSSYGNASVDIKVPYDISFKVNENKLEEFIKFVFDLSPKKNIDFNDVYENIEKQVNNIIKRVIGNSEIYIIEDLETSVKEIEEEIISELNSSIVAENYGVFFVKISIQLVDDYMHRQEKKRVQHNKYLYK